MDLKIIKKLISLMNTNDLVEVEIEEKGQKIRLKKNSIQNIPNPAPALAPSATPPKPYTKESDEAQKMEEGEHVFINSPMVGTFYQASSPEAEPFISPGDTITQDSVLCIIEAMKVMNEIKAEISGKIVELLVENGEAVEYGQPLYKVDVSKNITNS